MTHPEPYPIDKGIPAPASRRKVPPREPKRSRCPFASMQPGDSFYVPLCASRAKTLAALEHSLRVQAHQYGLGTYRSRQEHNGVRVWRIA